MGTLEELKETRLKLAELAREELAAEAFEKTDGLAEAMAQRYRMPDSVVAQIKLAGAEAVLKLGEMVSNIERVSNRDLAKLKVLELAMDKAFGKGETASALALASMRTSEALGTSRGGMKDALDKIEESGEFVPPEMRKAQRAQMKGYVPSPESSLTREVQTTTEERPYPRIPTSDERRAARDEYDRKVVRLDRSDIPRIGRAGEVA